MHTSETLLVGPLTCASGQKNVSIHYLPGVETDFLLAKISLLVCRSPTRISKRDFAAVETQFVYVTENRIKIFKPCR